MTNAFAASSYDPIDDEFDVDLDFAPRAAAEPADSPGDINPREPLQFTAPGTGGGTVVAHPAGHSPRRTGQATRHCAAHGGLAVLIICSPVARRLKSQTLALFGQQGFKFAQGCAGAHSDHQLAGLVTDDTGVGAGVKHLG